ncbi:MAG: YjbQ family protein [Ignavibacteriaceae bacterium]|nr:YjbQ family protein [Ignavibacteriaceae bacterium]
MSVKSKGNCDIIDITRLTGEFISDAGFDEGQILIFVAGSTAALTTIEYEPGLLKDYPNFFEKIIPATGIFEHNNTWHDGNGHSHVRASLQGPSITVPFKHGELLLGTWQQIILIDFDNRPRKRDIVLQIMGKKRSNN